jgi:predicted N-acetyltransferase YhbS
MPVLLRSATEADAKHVESLLAELGYLSKEADVRHRLRRSLCSDTSCFLVAQSASEVIGLVSAELVPYFPNGSTICRVTGLVVSTRHRGRGVGEKLFNGAADIIAQASRSLVRSIGLTRTGSTSGSGSREPRSDSSRPYKNGY